MSVRVSAVRNLEHKLTVCKSRRGREGERNRREETGE